MKNIDSTEKIELGEQVLTAGIELAGGIRSPYPKGLLLGQVIDVRRDANSVVQTAYLQPAADLEKLEYVLVVLDYAGRPAGGRTTSRSTARSPDPGGVVPGGEQPCIQHRADAASDPEPVAPPAP